MSERELTMTELAQQWHAMCRDEDAMIAAELSLTSCTGESPMPMAHGYVYGLAREDTDPLPRLLTLLRRRFDIRLPSDTTKKTFLRRLLDELDHAGDGDDDALGGRRTSVTDEGLGGAVEEPNLLMMSTGTWDAGRGVCCSDDAFAVYMSMVDAAERETATSEPPLSIPRSQPTRNEKLANELDALGELLRERFARSPRYPQSLWVALSLAMQRPSPPTDESLEKCQRALNAILDEMNEIDGAE